MSVNGGYSALTGDSANCLRSVRNDAFFIVDEFVVAVRKVDTVDVSFRIPTWQPPMASWRPALTAPDNDTLPPPSRTDVEVLYTIDESLSVQDLMAVMKREAVAFLAGCCSTH